MPFQSQGSPSVQHGFVSLCIYGSLPAASITSRLDVWRCQPARCFHPSLLSEEARGRALRLVRFHAANNGGPLSEIDDFDQAKIDGRRFRGGAAGSILAPGRPAVLHLFACCTKHVQVRVLLPYRLFDRTGILLVERRDGYGYQQSRKKNLEAARRLMAEIDFTKVVW